MSNLATVFHTAPKWTNVEAIDATDVINSAYKNAELQNKAFNNLADAGADVFRYAQQHKLNEVEKEINAMNLDQFQAADKAALVDGLVAKYGSDIGGFDAANMNRINKYVDDRDTTLLNDGIKSIEHSNLKTQQTLKNEEILVSNTANELILLEDTLKKLNPESEAYNELNGTYNNMITDIATNYPHLAKRIDDSITSARNTSLELEGKGIANQTAIHTAMADQLFPVYQEYLKADEELKARYANIGDLTGEELTKAKDAQTKDKTAFDTQYADFRKKLADPYVRGILVQKAQEEHRKGLIDQATLEKIISETVLNKDRGTALLMQGQASVTDSETRAYKAVSDVELAGKGYESKQATEAAKVTAAASSATIKNLGIEGDPTVLLNSDGSINANKVQASYVAWAKGVHTSYIQGFDRGYGIDKLPAGTYNKANKMLLEQAGSSAMTTLKSWMTESKLSSGDQAIIIKGIADGRLPITTGKWYEIRDHKDSTMTRHAKDTIAKFLTVEKATYRANLQPHIYANSEKYLKLLMHAEGSSSVEEHMNKHNSFYGTNLGNFQLRWTLDPSLVKISNQTTSRGNERTDRIPDLQNSKTPTVGKTPDTQRQDPKNVISIGTGWGSIL